MTCRLESILARRAAAFTLIELLAVAAIIAILSGLLLPALARGKEKAKVARVHTELRGIGLALDMYASDNDGRFPPTRANCNPDLASHWNQLPAELARGGYLPRGGRAGHEANMEDLFNPGHTYKYAAPGPLLLNGDPAGNFSLWIPESFPEMSSDRGGRFGDPNTSPVRWALWSLGPRPGSGRSLAARAPMSSQTWYRRTGDDGVIVRYADRAGAQFTSP